MDENQSKQRILLIDDSHLQVEALSNILSPQYTLKTANTGEDGLALIKKYNIDLIILDLFLPGMSGFEVLCHLKESEETKHIPVIFITSSNSDQDEIKGLALGAVDYVRKPFVDAAVKLRVDMHLKLTSQMKEIERLSLTDGLTGVNNRRSFEQAIKSEWGRAMRSKEWLGMLMIDVDNFKQLNDDYGHLSGDLCLKNIAYVLQKTIMRKTDFVFRFGGEEFAILMPGTSLEGVLTVAERIRKRVAEAPICWDNESVYVTVSIGAGAIIPSCRKGAESFEQFFAKLDKAMYRAKDKGRNRVETI